MQGNEKSFRGKDLTWSWAKSWVENGLNFKALELLNYLILTRS